MPGQRATQPRFRIDRLTVQDAGNLRVEEHGVPMHVAALAIVEGGPLRTAAGDLDRAAIIEHVDRRTRSAPRLRQRLTGTPACGGLPFWSDDPDFDIARHVRFRELPTPGDEATLLACCAELNEPPLDRSRPLWEMWLLNGSPDGTVAILIRLHHVVADGVAALGLLGALFDTTVAHPVPPTPERPPAAATRTRDLYGDQLRRAGSALRRCAAGLRHPRAIIRRVGAGVGQARRLLGEGSAPRISLNRPVSTHRQLTLVRADLGRAREVAHRCGGTVNDVVLAAVAGGARQLLDHRGELRSALVLKVSESASLRSASTPRPTGNQVGMRLVPLPLDEPDAVRRLTAIARGTADRRGQPAYQPGGRLLQRWMVRVMFRQRLVNILASNLPGPAADIYFDGARVRELFQIGVLQGNIGLSVGVLSYADRLTFDLLTDADHVPDAAEFAAGLTAALRELGMLSRDREPDTGQSLRHRPNTR